MARQYYDTLNPDMMRGLLISPQPDQEGKKLQRKNSGFIQHAPHAAQYTSQAVALHFESHSKKKSECCPSNQVSVAAMTSASHEKWRPFNCFFSPGNRWQSDGARSRPTGNHLDHSEKIPKVAQTTGTLDVFDPRSGISGPTSRRAVACPALHK